MQRPIPAADSVFSDTLTASDVATAVRYLKAAILHSSSGRDSSSALRSALYGDYLSKLLERMFGEHKCVRGVAVAVCLLHLRVALFACAHAALVGPRHQRPAPSSPPSLTATPPRLRMPSAGGTP